MCFYSILKGAVKMGKESESSYYCQQWAALTDPPFFFWIKETSVRRRFGSLWKFRILSVTVPLNVSKHFRAALLGPEGKNMWKWLNIKNHKLKFGIFGRFGRICLVHMDLLKTDRDCLQHQILYFWKVLKKDAKGITASNTEWDHLSEM